MIQECDNENKILRYDNKYDCTYLYQICNIYIILINTQYTSLNINT